MQLYKGSASTHLPRYNATRCSLIVTCHSLIGFWWICSWLIGLWSNLSVMYLQSLNAYSHLRSSGFRFLLGVHSLNPLYAQFTVGFALLWEANATSYLTGGRAQVVVWAVRVAMNTDEASLASSSPCCVAQFLTGHRLVAVCDPGVGDHCGALSFKVAFTILVTLYSKWILDWYCQFLHMVKKPAEYDWDCMES